jgi:hypothetical protein
MSKWDFILNKLGKAAPKVAKEEEMFPAIKALLKKEQGKEKFGKNTFFSNPSLMDGDKKYTLAKFDDLSDLYKSNPYVANNNLALMSYIKKDVRSPNMPSEEIPLDMIHHGDRIETWLRGDPIMNSAQRDLQIALDKQPILWADDVVKKKGIPKIEDALIREREREKLFNTNNPLFQSKAVPSVATELRQIKNAPSGASRFESVDKWLKRQGGKYDPKLEDDIEEQLQGRRFFFPVKADITEMDPTKWLGEYLNNKPKLSRFKGKTRQNDSFSYPWINDANVFFADGTEI